MKKTILTAALAAAFAFPAHAHETVLDEDGPKHEFTFQIDMGEILAQADDARTRGDAARARAEAGRARADEARARAVEGRALAEVDWTHNLGDEMSGAMSFMFGDRAGRGRVVKGHPYSADIVTETNQTLPDGNVISHRNVNKVWRDGEGRTRQESYRAEKLRSVYISDPVEGMAYTVLPNSKIAVAIPRMDLHRELQHELHHDLRAPRAERDGKSGRTSTETTTTTEDGRRRVVVRTVNRDGEPGVREEVRVQVMRVGDDSSIVVTPAPPVPPVPPVPPTPATPPTPPIPPIPPITMIPGVHTMRFESTSHLGKGETKSMGTKDFEGVKAEGKLTTWTIAAGKIGNRNPIAVTSESWYSPELQVTVYSRHNDPRTGESLYRLASIKRAEPRADLFKVPEGYTMKGRTKDKAKDKSRDKP